MLNTLRSAFKVKEIRDRIFYTFLMLIVVRIGSQLPVPGVDSNYISNWFAQQAGEMMNFFDAVTGGSFMKMSIFALSITPYITSSIIMQLLTIAIPKLEELQKDGEEGRKKIAEVTRYLTVGLALVESIAMAVGFGRQGLLEQYNAWNVIIVVVALTAGSAFLMWMGERITEKGVGNGISIILLINIVSRVPQDFKGLFDTFVKGKNVGMAGVAILIILGVVIMTVAFVVILQGGQRRIPVQYSKKIQGRKMVGGQSTHIPLKVNTAGVIPIIFASSIMSFPQVIVSIVGAQAAGPLGEVLKVLNSSNWCNPKQLQYSVGLLIYVVLVVFFAYFYTSVTFNPIEVSNNMKKQGGFIPGIRPGKPTTDYLTQILNYVIFIGAAALIIVAIVPIFFSGIFGAQVSFGGTSMIIIVGVVLETMKQIESKIVVRNYKGFLTD